MRIGYYVEDSGHVALLQGLTQRWCPHAELIAGIYRGSSKVSRRRELGKAVIDLMSSKNCDVVVLLADSDTNAWKLVRKEDFDRVPVECIDITLVGICERNVECWLAIDRNQLSNVLGCDESDIPIDDPSGFVKRRFGLTLRDYEKDEAIDKIARFVEFAGLNEWIIRSVSFKAFYEDVRDLSQLISCDLPNEVGEG